MPRRKGVTMREPLAGSIHRSRPMHPLSRRRFLAASAAPAATPLLARLFAAEKKPAADNPIPSANCSFGCDLYAKLRAEKGNVFFSPFGIETALAMTANGAKA